MKVPVIISHLLLITQPHCLGLFVLLLFTRGRVFEKENKQPSLEIPLAGEYTESSRILGLFSQDRCLPAHPCSSGCSHLPRPHTGLFAVPPVDCSLPPHWTILCPYTGSFTIPTLYHSLSPHWTLPHLHTRPFCISTLDHSVPLLDPSSSSQLTLPHPHT